MKKYKVTEKDLKGELKDFPIEIVQRMVDLQHEQGLRFLGVGTMQKYRLGGFFWNKTPEGTDFWHKVIVDKNFDEFFNRYPAQNTEKEQSPDNPDEALD